MINEQTIRKWWDLFVKDNGFTEVRILGRFQYSGYFKSVDNLINAIKPYSDLDDEQMYFVLNRIDDACYGRQQSEKIVKSPKITTNDNDITRRNFVFVDFDPVRKSGTNASNEEFALAHKKAQDVFRFLRDKGFSEPIICKSGNGLHLTYKVDLPNDEETTETIKRFYEYLGSQFSDNKVDIDTKVFNLARLCKLYGTTAKKGANLQDRPWRMSEIIYVPKELKLTPFEKFKELADLLPKEEPKVAPNRPNRQYNNAPFDLRTWLNEHGIVYKEEKQGTSTRFTLEKCPWIDQHSDHKNWDSALFQDTDGKITFNCQHSHCKGKTWMDFRLFYEPDAYSKPAYQPMMPMYQRGFVTMKPKYQIKEETPELGKKWLSMSEIEKVDLSAIPRVKTGVREIDRLLLGLAECEVTLLSGGNASGKSSWLNTLICNFVEQGVPNALFSGELPKQILKAWIQMVAAGRNNLKPSTFGDGKFYVPNAVAKRIDDWMDGKFYLFNNDYGNTWEEIFADMTDLLKMGVKVFTLDNLMSMDIDLLEGDKNNKQKNLILQLKNFAKSNHAHIIIVAHPRKSMAFLRKNDISGTADLTNAVDNVFIAHRVNQDFLKAGAEFYGQAYIQQFQGYGNVIEISKNRMYGICDVLVGLHYEIESRRFKNDPNENIRYGWERDPIQGQMSFDAQQQGAMQGNWNYNEQAQAEMNGMPFAPPTEDVPF